jgi:hypothetical protein
MSRLQSRADVGKLPIVDNDVMKNYALNDLKQVAMMGKSL